MNSSQTNLTNLPESDLELLSAYLDNQLSVAERVSLERRLSAEPSLRAELAELRETAAVLRALEPVRPPRSFALDPATAPRPRFFLPLAWVMQMGSGLAGLALVLLATIQFAAVGAMPAAAPAPMAAMATSDSTVASGPATMLGAPAAATAAPSATQAPTSAAAAESVPAAGAEVRQPEATTSAATTQDQSPATEPAPEAGVAGGTTGGPLSNSPAPPPGNPNEGVGGSGSTDGAAREQPARNEAPPATIEPAGFPPALILALGVALIALGAGWHLYSRRRA